MHLYEKSGYIECFLMEVHRHFQPLIEEYLHYLQISFFSKQILKTRLSQN